MTDVHCPKGGRHEFSYEYTYGGGEIVAEYWECHKCQHVVGADTITRLLNAAMQLTADEAEQAADLLTPAEFVDTKESFRQRRYARTWRGDTEESE